jgi:hypothetical protein
METQTNRAIELLLAGLRDAERDGAVLSWQQEDGADYVDVKAKTKFSNLTREVVIRCYEPDRLLTPADIHGMDLAAKASKTHMALIVGDGRDAIQAAKIEGIGLLPYDMLTNVASGFWANLFKPVLLVYGFRFRIEQQSNEIAIPEEPALLAYMMKELRIVGTTIDTTPEHLVKENDRSCAETATGTPKTFTLELPPCTFLVHPNTKGKTPVSTFSFDYRLIPVSELIREQALAKDHYGLGSGLEEALAKRNSDADPKQIHSGFTTRLRFGKYYYNPMLQFSYYCESARKGTAKLVLLESYQGGHLLQARLEVGTTWASQYVEITNSKELERLSKLYQRFTVSDKNLEGRFTEFVRSLDGSECIDDLDLTPEQAKAQKADYFFNGRTIISEFKSLQSNSSTKISAILAPYRNSPEWPFSVSRSGNVIVTIAV